jgi:hypothetical protein
VRAIVQNFCQLGKGGCLPRQDLDGASKDEKVRIYVYVTEWHVDGHGRPRWLSEAKLVHSWCFRERNFRGPDKTDANHGKGGSVEGVGDGSQVGDGGAVFIMTKQSNVGYAW